MNLAHHSRPNLMEFGLMTAFPGEHTHAFPFTAGPPEAVSRSRYHTMANASYTPSKWEEDLPAVLGTTSARSSRVMRPRSLPPASMSKKTYSHHDYTNKRLCQGVINRVPEQPSEKKERGHFVKDTDARRYKCGLQL